MPAGRPTFPVRDLQGRIATRYGSTGLQPREFKAKSEVPIMSKTIRTLALVLTFSFPAASQVSTALGCPACKDTVAGGDGSTGEPIDPGVASTGGVSGGFNTSVYLMLGAFLGTLGLVGYTLVRGARSGNGVYPTTTGTPNE
jgi:hypothetical protein